MEYPVIFRCSECTLEHDTLDLLVCHIWSRHLRAFPYSCIHCNYPALTINALGAHFTDVHGINVVEFKRRISDEIRLYDFIAASIVVPLYDDEFKGADEEVLYLQDPHSQSSDQELVEESEDTVNPVVEEVANEEVHDELEEVVDTGQGGYLSAGPSNQREQSDIEEDSSFIFADENGLYENQEEVDIEYVEHDGHIFISDFAPNGDGSGPRRRDAVMHRCDICGKIMKYPSKIEEHRRSHTGERPHKCNQCNASFTQKGALKVHLRLHSGEKPYPCSWECGKSFPSSSAQKMHEKSHSGEKPHLCRFCGKSFSKRSHSVRHEQTRHRSVTFDDPSNYDEDTYGMEKPVVDAVIDEVHRDHEMKKKV